MKASTLTKITKFCCAITGTSPSAPAICVLWYSLTILSSYHWYVITDWQDMNGVTKFLHMSGMVVQLFNYTISIVQNILNRDFYQRLQDDLSLFTPDPEVQQSVIRWILLLVSSYFVAFNIFYFTYFLYFPLSLASQWILMFSFFFPMSAVLSYNLNAAACLHHIYLLFLRLSPTSTDSLLQFHRLTLACETVDGLFSVQTTFTLLSTLVIFANYLYDIEEHLRKWFGHHHNANKIMTPIPCLSLLFMWIVLLIIIATSYSKLQNQAEKFTIKLHKVLHADRSNRLVNDCKVQLHLNWNWKATFSACGFFDLDNTIIQSIAAASTMYWVILIQFNK